MIIGGESGHNARKSFSKVDSAQCNQCKATAILVYVKQLGTEEAKQSATHRSDTKGANPQM